MPDMPSCVSRYSNYNRVIKGRSEKTISEYEHDLLIFLRFIKAKKDSLPVNDEIMQEIDISTLEISDIKEITRFDVLSFLDYAARDRENKGVTRARKLSSIKGFFKYLLIHEKAIDENPADNIDTPKTAKTLPKFLSLDESILLLDTVKNDINNPRRERDYCILTLFLNCGVRLSELTGLSLADIDRDFRSMRVVGKGNKERIVYLNDACAEALAAYIPLRAKDGEIKDKNALFISRNHKRISNQMVQVIVYKYLDMAGLGNKKYSVHKLRHTAATLMYQTGKVDVRVLKDILGHEQLNTTQIYTHVSDRGMEDAMRQNPLSKKRSK